MKNQTFLIVIRGLAPFSSTKYNTSSLTMKSSLRLLIPLFFVLLPCGRSFADFTWQGVSDSSFANSGNWDVAPVPNSTNSGAIIIGNNSGKPLIYTENEGSTTFTGQLKVGKDDESHSPGELVVKGGKLTISDANWGASIGQTTSGTVTVSGGSLNLTGGHATFVGNEGNGTINLTNGTIFVDGDLYVARNSAISGQNNGALIKISGGKFTVGGQTIFDVDGGAGAGGSGLKEIEFDSGDGTFVQTNSGELQFPGPNDADTAYVNFVKGSKGVLSLHGATQSYFEELVNKGRIKVNGQTARPSDFQFSTADGQGLYKLSP